MLTPDSQYWRTIHGNQVDIAVLEWCKLFVEGKEKYAWKKVVSERTAFEVGLLKRLKISDKEFASYTKSIKHYRDKFVAHLDDENEMQIPQFDLAWAAIQFYYEHATEIELPKEGGKLKAGEDRIQDYYNKHFQEALEIYRSLGA